MPQIHFVASRDLAFKTAFAKIWPAPDDAGAIASAHLVIEALLHTLIRSKLPHPEALEPANLRFHQAMCLTVSLRRKAKKEEWIWLTLDQLNRIRNRLSHDISQAEAPYRAKADRIAQAKHGFAIHNAVEEFAAVLTALLVDAKAGLLASVADQARGDF